jgi:hypothetical protein
MKKMKEKEDNADKNEINERQEGDGGDEEEEDNFNDDADFEIQEKSEEKRKQSSHQENPLEEEKDCGDMIEEKGKAPEEPKLEPTMSLKVQVSQGGEIELEQASLFKTKSIKVEAQEPQMKSPSKEKAPVPNRPYDMEQAREDLSVLAREVYLG